MQTSHVWAPTIEHIKYTATRYLTRLACHVYGHRYLSCLGRLLGEGATYLHVTSSPVIHNQLSTNPSQVNLPGSEVITADGLTSTYWQDVPHLPYTCRFTPCPFYLSLGIVSYLPVPVPVCNILHTSSSTSSWYPSVVLYYYISDLPSP